MTTAPAIPATKFANWCYFGMFYNCSSLTTAPELPAKTLTPYCYASMFYNCSLLTSASALPVKTLANSCYSSMFSGCTSLTTAPELPATTLTTGCYQYMFYNCKKINYIKAMFLTTPSTTYLNNWIYGVPSSSGTFVMSKDAMWNPEDYRGMDGVPVGWEVKYCDPNNLDDIRDNKDDFYPQEINIILESVVIGEKLDNMDSLLQQISQSQEDMSSINTQLENIINT